MKHHTCQACQIWSTDEACFVSTSFPRTWRKSRQSCFGIENQVSTIWMTFLHSLDSFTAQISWLSLFVQKTKTQCEAVPTLSHKHLSVVLEKPKTARSVYRKWLCNKVSFDDVGVEWKMKCVILYLILTVCVHRKPGYHYLVLSTLIVLSQCFFLFQILIHPFGFWSHFFIRIYETSVQF